MPPGTDGTTWEYYNQYASPNYERVGHCYRYIKWPKKGNDRILNEW